MRLGFLSDLHLAPGRSNRCTSSEDDLLALLDWIEQRCDRVILVGDIFDLLRPAAPRAWRAHERAIERSFPRLTPRLLGFDAVYGNHDAPRANAGVPEELLISHERGDVLICHGHQADPWLKKVWGLEEAANFVAGWFERLELSPIARAMGHVPGLLDPRGWRRGDAPEQREGAGEFGEEVERGDLQRSERFARATLQARADVVVMGHSHGLGLNVLAGGLYMNTGAHVHGHLDACLLDLDAGIATTWRDGECGQIGVRGDQGEWELWRVGDVGCPGYLIDRVERAERWPGEGFGGRDDESE